MNQKLLRLLLNCQQVNFSASSQTNSKMGWNYYGIGEVKTNIFDEYVIFYETIQLNNGSICHDKKRWHWQKQILGFERWREGKFQQIFQFQHHDGAFIMLHTHKCLDDLYQARFSIKQNTLELKINIHGPKKNETLLYSYT